MCCYGAGRFFLSGHWLHRYRACRFYGWIGLDIGLVHFYRLDSRVRGNDGGVGNVIVMGFGRGDKGRVSGVIIMGFYRVKNQALLII